ncbi:hypothetical protein DPMN_155413 [Dreissena polymorpha]|uniref:Uncharacterized protein n=1 Tax=Dreissena polymorpha TaxID=45954 RepID=A0A9D4FTN8_DREPO|nr:hypothetical protein DPMN_155413 [Dreissena polymorpha]
MLNQKLGTHIETRDIDVAHRLGKYARHKCRPVIVKFVRRQTKIEIMKRAKLLKGTDIFINEDLTKINAKVLASLRLKEPELVEKAWSRDGKLFVRYRGQERKYKLWMAKSWPTNTYATNKTTYARKVSNGSASNRQT